MCIAILSTTHPHYRLIVINNRDEFLNRPTSRADWWPSPHTHVLGARDLARPIHGTWLGLTKQGRIAILTNFHETSRQAAVGLRSRGAIVNSWLTPDPTAHGPSIIEFVDELQTSPGLNQIGGFNLLCGNIDEPLAILSNRSESDRVQWLVGEEGQTVAISNTHLGDYSWKKVGLGERLMSQAISESLQENENEDFFIERLFQVLSTDTMPRLPGGVGLEAYLNVVPHSIFIPVIGGRISHETGANSEHNEDGLAEVKGRLDPIYLEGLYGTQRQTVVLVGHDGRVRYVERSLYDDDGRAVPEEERDRSFDFMVEPRYESAKL